MSGYSIRDIPNTPELRATFKALERCQRYRPRGRGLPPGKRWRDVQYGTALCEAPKFTAYYGTSPYAYFEYVGLDSNGKPIVRML